MTKHIHEGLFATGNPYRVIREAGEHEGEKRYNVSGITIFPSGRNEFMKKTFTMCAAALFLVCVAAGLSGAALSDGEFLSLCEKGTPAELEAAVKEGANLGALDQYGKTPLMRAARSNPNPDSIRILIAAGADLHAKNSFGAGVLAYAVDNPNTEILRIFLDAGLDVNEATPRGATPLMFAAGSTPNPEALAVVTLLLEAGADLHARDKDGLTAFLRAAELSRNPGVLSALLRAGADINETKDPMGWTALMRAARFNPYPDMVQRLLEEGADVDGATAEGFTPLMLVAALRTENPGPVVELLLKAGADIDAKDTYGWTALMRAAAQNANPEMTGLLLRAGADASLRNNNGESALDVAARNDALKNTEEYRMLEEASK